MDSFSYELRIPKERVAVLIGTDGIIKKKIENETKSELDIDSKEGDVIITGSDALKLYAARETIQGFAFSADSRWQQELESSFSYIETRDQLEAVQAVKHDMETKKPMDRVICGDVGYGKTEIALRAAFKAVMDNKQVALLVPTTILAQQHLYTFRERLQAFPVRIEVLSRLCSPPR